MHSAIRTSRTAVAAFLSGLLCIACSILAFLSEADLFLAGVALFAVLAIVLGIVDWIRVRQAPLFWGNALAGWAITLSVAGLALGFVLLPAT